MIGAAHIAAMRDGAILANAGHFDVEIDVRALTDLATAVHQDVRPHVDAYELGDGRTMLLLAEGRVVNLVAAEGHPPEVMDVAFGIEALALAWLAGAVSPENTVSSENTVSADSTGGKLPPGVHEVPVAIDAEAAGSCWPPRAPRSTRSPPPAGLSGVLALGVLKLGVLERLGPDAAGS